MDEKKLNKELREIRKGMKLFDGIVNVDYKSGEGKLTEKQTVIVKKLFTLFQSLNWQLSFNNYKELRYGEDRVINDRGCGTPVKIRPCADECKGKTYFGILIGDVALAIGHKIEDGIVTANLRNYNPAIFVPELGKIIYGIESWWGEIKNEDELNKLITDEVIDNVWYVKMLKQQYKDRDEKNGIE